ncbi:MAG: PQQ-binding-like beta-propeller repeat protein [Ignavibacteriales bacterium]|nr:PQQ-binding-like beta-propeller repeat protein [Ignavibacteriales bacterium]
MRTLIRSSFIIFLLLSSAVFAQRQSFRFAWLSDTHVGSQTGAADLSSSVRDINGMNDIAFVILSGDITEIGSDAQQETAKSILDSLKKPYYIIPGNHDTKWSQSGCTEFLALWGSDKFTFTYGGYRFIGIHQGPIMKMGDGHFSPEDLRWLDSTLAAFPKKTQPLFFITHYPLDPGIDNWYTVVERLKQCNTQVVLVGHGHTNEVMNFEGLPGVMGRSNLRERETAGAFTIVDVNSEMMFFTERTPKAGWKNPWHSVGIGQRDFSRDTRRYSRPDSVVNKTYPGTQTRWSVDTRFTIASTPAVWKDCVISGNSSGMVNCYSARDGSLKWRFKTAGTVYSTPDVSDGRVVIGSSDRNIYCLDANRGTPLWRIQTGAPVVAAATIRDGLVYIGGSDGVFRALDLKTGKVKWEFKNVGGFVETKPLVYKEMVIFGAWDTYLYALSVKDGSLLWKWSNGNTGVLYSPAACWPVAANGKVFVVAPDRFMTAIDARTGKTIWRSKQHQVRECVGISEDGKRIYVRCMTDTVVAFSSSASSPAEVWTTNCGYGYDIDPSMPIERGGVVYFGTKNGLIFALDAHSGAIRWEHRIGVTITSTPVLLENRRVIVSDLDGKISLLGEKH